MNKYAKVYRFLKEDMGIINEVITLSCKKERNTNKVCGNREDHADASIWKSTLKIILQVYMVVIAWKYFLQKEWYFDLNRGIIIF